MTTSVNLYPSPLLSRHDTDTPIGVRRLNDASVRACQQKNSVTGLYVGQAATFEIAGERCTFSEGDLLILSEHAVLNVEQVVDVWVLKFRWDVLALFLSGTGHTSTWHQFAATLGTPAREVEQFRVPEEVRSTWQHCLQSLDQELRVQQLGYFESARAQLTLLIVSLARVLEEDITSRPLVEDPLVAKTLAYIEGHFHEPLTLKQLAEHVHRSPTYLTTRVREQIGQSVMDYVIARRMQEAEQLLTTTDEPISAIGETVGYPEPSTFSRLFRKRQALPPAAWRKVRRQDKRDEQTTR